ncbi:hypothetical protein [Winogradskyella aquimaris]|uniref:Uncharacterized protein n=1 Tax=Winogradskyella aquimaris TaxID=864074 RepID=A0ABU5EK34_9FLAO|nr:hypothetical protein [Winogradskyella aquimaris]MDY2586735.1 hypothetical protein [Winogradskyella aquimaris]
MNDRTIYTINARGNMFLEITKEYFSLDDNVMHSEINGMFNELIKVLNSKGIKYESLKSCLIPKYDRKEIGLIFDSTQIENDWYGYEVFTKLIPLFHKDSTHSILCGDYIGDIELQNDLFFRFYSQINQTNEFEYKHSTQFFIVYINNLSENMFDKLTSDLKGFHPFIGFFDLTNQSFMKSYLSTILANSFIKTNKTIIMEHEDDRDNSENINLKSYPFEQSGYNVKSLQGIYYGVFLSYKIEREVFEGFESDIDFSLNSISPLVSKIKEIEIEDNKFDYLKTVKKGKLKKANLISYSKNEFTELIKKKIKSNYIYNMTDLKSFNIFKFDILIELLNTLNEIVKITIGFEYIPKKEKLRLITLY